MSLLSIIGAFLIILGGFVLAMWLYVLIFSAVFALFCAIACLGIIGGIAAGISYVVLGFGLLGRRSWALTLTPVFMIIIIVLFVILLVFAATPLGLLILGPVILVHVVILALVSWERGRYRPKPVRWLPIQQPVVLERVEGLTCEECGSEDIRIYPDGSGICQNCKNVFSSIPKKP